ncbi:Receptor-like protein kinase HAIKU2 [Acorus gramineus]|uniref:Receptor-like protein kinase HAIKU2 n=1 Tax=Acorus gramineus TaxID=55184 RepID=A0AAV9A5W1_ACOGR|nr:Receptor-like protein kinase HAIKU2 [Acorus gramineus]
MELVTGKKPIELEFRDNNDIVTWIFSQMTNRENLLSVVDPKIPQHLREDAIKALRIGVLYTARLPRLRPSMLTVVHTLEDAKTTRVRLD